MELMKTQVGTPRIAVVSVCLNDEKVLPLFLANMQMWENANFHYIFVDNGSSDCSLDLVRSRLEAVTIIKLCRNLGTTGAYNYGIRRAQEMGADYALLLALDVLLAPECLWILINEMDAHPDIGAIGPILLKSHDKGLVECMGFTINRDRSFSPNFGAQRELLSLPATLDTDYIDGGTSLFRMSALEKIGLLDERLFMYNEDVDICLRLKHQGYRIVATAKTRAWHRHSEIRMADPRPRPYQVFYQLRNQVYLVKKHSPRTERLLYYLGLIRRMPRQLAYFAVREHSMFLAAVYLEALWHGLTDRMGKTKYVQ
jgi:hypothetical protein